MPVYMPQPSLLYRRWLFSFASKYSHFQNNVALYNYHNIGGIVNDSSYYDKEKYLQEPIEILELIARLTKILKDNGIHTITDVYALRIVEIDMRGVLRLELFNVLNELELEYKQRAFPRKYPWKGSLSQIT